MVRQKPARLAQAISSGVVLLTLTIAGAQRSAPRIEIDRPLADERFVAGEPILFHASLLNLGAAAARATWTSSLAGELGRGASIEVKNLPAGTHDVAVAVDGVTRSVRIRVFGDLLQLFRAEPADGELARLRKEFAFTWEDGSQPDERWKLFEPPSFAIASTQPSKSVLLAKLDTLRHQRFDEPLPFGDGLTVFDHLQRYVKRFVVRLDCGNASGGGGVVSLPRHASTWYASTANCREVLPGQKPLGYEGTLGLLLHEVRHSQRGDPGHRACRNHPALDATIDNGSGFAWSTLYFMWVYRYGSFDPPEIKDRAKQAARSMLQYSFCNSPSSADPKVQAVIDEFRAAGKS